MVPVFLLALAVGWHPGDSIPEGCRVVRGRNGPMVVQQSPTYGKSHAVVGEYPTPVTVRRRAPVPTPAKPKYQWFPSFAIKFDENMKPGVSINAVVLPSR